MSTTTATTTNGTLGNGSTVPAASAGDIDPNHLPLTSLVTKQLSTVTPQIPSQLSVVNTVLQSLLHTLSTIERRTHDSQTLIAIYRSTRVPPVSFAIAAFVALLVALRRATRANAPLVANVFGIVWPAYKSLRAVERPESDDEERWLTYWPVFGLFTVFDQFHERIRRYFPLYFTAKCIALYYLFARNGSLKVYRSVVRPLLISYNGLSAENSTVSSATTATHSREGSQPYKTL